MKNTIYSYRFYVFLLFLFLFSAFASGQYLVNPSFEGPTGQDIVPPGWSPCKTNSTPDTQPGAWSCVTPPSNGNSYSNLVTRGNLGPYANSTEDMQAALLKPMYAGNCYHLSIDLAISPDWGHFINWGDDWLSYGNPVILKIWGGYGSCQKSEILWTSQPIIYINWLTYSLTVIPTADINYLILEADYASMPEYFGNVLIDNIVLNDYADTKITKLDTTITSEQTFQLNASTGTSYSWYPSQGLSCVNCQSPMVTTDESITYEVTITDSIGCSYKEEFIINVEISIPNVFTPNNDGKNETFEIKGLPSDYLLQIFNRWGQKVYSQANYSNNWHGTTERNKQLPAGVYYYVLTSPDLKQHFNGSITLIR